MRSNIRAKHRTYDTYALFKIAKDASKEEVEKIVGEIAGRLTAVESKPPEVVFVKKGEAVPVGAKFVYQEVEPAQNQNP